MAVTLDSESMMGTVTRVTCAVRSSRSRQIASSRSEAFIDGVKLGNKVVINIDQSRNALVIVNDCRMVTGEYIAHLGKCSGRHGVD